MSDFDFKPATSCVIAIDMQERFSSAIASISPQQTTAIATTQLLEAATLLQIPVLISEQYPAKLGPTLTHIQTSAPAATILSKTHFSVYEDPEMKRLLASWERKQVIIAGIEAHICVLSTALDMLRHGYDVIVAADAVASRQSRHCDLACDQLRACGCLVLPVESILFRWQRQAGVGVFKAISALVR